MNINKKINTVFSDWNKNTVPGGAVGIIKDNQLIFSHGYGSADIENNQPNTPQTVFYIGSLSKQFITFSLLLLEEQGKLDLDNTVQTYLNDFPTYQAPLTIRHLIHHMSGLKDFFDLFSGRGLNYLDHIDRQSVYEMIKEEKDLIFTPGEKHQYSNSCYFLLAMVIEKASGTSCKEFAQKEIFTPLGMKNTIVHDNHKQQIQNLAISYEKNGKTFKRIEMQFDLVGSGGIYSSIEDLFLWDQNFYQNKLGKGTQEILTKMHQDGKLNNGESSGYAFGLYNRNYKGIPSVLHSGSLAGYRSQFLRFPKEKTSIIILSNRSDAETKEKAHQIADILLT